MFAALRSGSFVTRERMRGYSVLLLVGYTAATIFLLATADGILDWSGRPIGTDFVNVYAAGRLADTGRSAMAYDWTVHHAMEKVVAGRADLPYYGWHYPPVFLLLAAALAALPYLAALITYQLVSMAGYLCAVRRITGGLESRLVILLALAFPATFVNIGHGHNGFITAALLAGGLSLLERRPFLAGALFGCLVYKPQFAILIPLVLAATSRWRPLAASAAAALGLCAAAWAAFGTEVYAAFWQSLALTQKVIADGAPGFYKIQSVYAGLRLLGAPAGLADALQLLVTVGVAALLVMLWRSASAFELKAAALLLGSLLATPYVLDYDWVVLAPAIAFLAVHGRREGFAPYEITALALLWLLPFAARPVALATSVSVGPVILLGVFALIVHRAGILQSARAVMAPRVG